MRFVITSTGSTGAIYLQRLLDIIDYKAHEVHLVLSNYAKEVIHSEIGKLKTSSNIIMHSNKSMNAPFASGTSEFDAMIVLPCSMATLGKIANGIGDSLITRSADVFLKERKTCIIVPRETPWNLIHAENACTVIRAGATLMPAMPSFYTKPKSIEDLVDTLVFRILDHMGIPSKDAYRWKS